MGGLSNGSAHHRLAGTILLVDDELRSRDILKEFLELSGFDVETADSGEACLQRLEGALPRVILLDVRMGGMDGIMTLRHIRVRHPNLPVVLTTQIDDVQVVEEAGVLGANDYLIKPLDFEQVKTTLLVKIFS